MTSHTTPRTLASSRTAVGLLLLALAGAAQAHTGHGTTSLAQGLAHPLGLDHLLAIVAVGIWSVSALPARQAWQGPAMFLGAMVAGAVLGLSGASVPFLEYLIAGSVVLCGVLLASVHLKLPHGVALACVTVSAAMHGLAHGAEAPGAGFGLYAAGFVLTTSALHLSGVAAGLYLRHRFARQVTRCLTFAGAAFGASGVYLLTQV